MKIVTEVPVEIDDLALSLLGWEVHDLRARVITDNYGRGNNFHKLALSGVLRFNPADWVDCFDSNREYLPPVVITVGSDSLSEEVCIFRPFYASARDARRPVRFSENSSFVHTNKPIKHEDICVNVTALDSFDGDGSISRIPVGIKRIPVEVVDETEPSSVQLVLDRIDAYTHKGDPFIHGSLRASGHVTYGSPKQLLEDHVASWRRPPHREPTLSSVAPFSRRAPSISFDITDESGFLLDQVEGDVDIHVHVDKDGNGPTRIPRWAIDATFDPDDFPSTAARVIARVEDG